MSPLRDWVRKLGSFGLLGVALLPAPVLAQSFEWSHVDTTGLSQLTPAIEPGADAEILLREVSVLDEYNEDFIAHYSYHLRIKVFTARGVETQSTVRIPHGKRVDIEDVQARTLKPDGTVVPVEGSAIFHREVVRAKGVKEDEVNFAFPAVEPGAILEYRYKETRHGESSNGLRLPFSTDLPTVHCVYRVKPLEFPGLDMHFRGFGPGATGFSQGAEGYYRADAYRLRAWRAEPMMPSAWRTKAWSLIYYEPEGETDPERYWRDFSRHMFDATQPLMDPDADIQQAAKSAIGDATEPLEKLQRLYRACRSAVRTIEPGKPGKAPHDHARASEILEAGAGTSDQVDFVFGGLCRAAGFDARMALLADRRQPPPAVDFLSTRFINYTAVAVHMPDDSWTFFDPGVRSLGFATVPSSQEGVRALISGSNDAVWATTSVASPGTSVNRRRGSFHLDDEGALEGDVRDEATGHAARERRGELEDLSPAERVQQIKDGVTSRLTGAELTAISVEGVEDADLPLVVRYHLRVPGYASSTEKRIILQPGVFEHGHPPLFTGETRRNPIEFPYAWMDSDSIGIELPPGVTLETGESPPAVRAPGLASYAAELHPSADGKALIWERQEIFGLGGALSFPGSSYSSLKDFFGAVAQRDEYSVTLLRKEGSR